MLYSYFFNMLKVGVPGFTQVPQLLVYNLLSLYLQRIVQLIAGGFLVLIECVGVDIQRCR